MPLHPELEHKLNEAGLLKQAKSAKKWPLTVWHFFSLIIAIISTALILLGIYTSLSPLVEQAAYMIGMGFIILVSSTYAYRQVQDIYEVRTGLLVLSLLGQAHLLIGMIALKADELIIIHSFLILASSLFYFIRNWQHRLWCLVVIIACISYLFYDWGWRAYLYLFFSGAALILWSKEYDWARYWNSLQLIAYALTLTSLILLSFKYRHIGHDGAWLQAFLFLMLSAYILNFFNPILRLGISLLLGLIAAYLPGLSFAILLLLIAFEHGNEHLVIVALIGVLFYISQYYYLMRISLLQKSLVLAISGTVLLGLRHWIMHYEKN